jgi:hypothetical protein
LSTIATDAILVHQQRDNLLDVHGKGEFGQKIADFELGVLESRCSAGHVLTEPDAVLLVTPEDRREDLGDGVAIQSKAVEPLIGESSGLVVVGVVCREVLGSQLVGDELGDELLVVVKEMGLQVLVGNFTDFASALAVAASELVGAEIALKMGPQFRFFELETVIPVTMHDLDLDYYMREGNWRVVCPGIFLGVWRIRLIGI